MKHLVKCKYCEQMFDRDSEPFIQVSAKRYAHKKCAEEHEQNKTKEERDLEALEKYIMQLFDEPYINARIRKQLKEYQEKYNYTYSGMLKTLIYWFEIKGNSTEQANGGIGIVPYVYNQALQYYYSLWLAQQANKEKDIDLYKPKVKEIEIFPPKIHPKKIKLLFDSEEEHE